MDESRAGMRLCFKERKHMEEQGRQLTKKGVPMSNFVSHLSKDAAAARGDRFLVLRNKTRLRLMDVLSRYGGLLCVVEIAEVLDETPSAISSHLAMLRSVKLVESEKFGAFVYYSLREGALDQYKQYLEQLASSPVGE